MVQFMKQQILVTGPWFDSFLSFARSSLEKEDLINTIRVNKCLIEVFYFLLIMEFIEVNGENAEATIWYERSWFLRIWTISGPERFGEIIVLQLLIYPTE